MVRKIRRKHEALYPLHHVDDLTPDESNPRKADPTRLHLLRLSLSKLGFILPVAITRDGLILSGHQRVKVAKELGFTYIPVQLVDVEEKDIKGINVIFNRVTNDFGALDTGSGAFEDLKLSSIIDEAEKLPDWSNKENEEKKEWYARQARMQDISGLGKEIAELYDKKAVVAAENFIRKGIQIPIVVSASGMVVNGVHRLFAARENGIDKWPVVTVSDKHAEFATHFLNYLSMDFHVDEEFSDLLRYSAYRRPQNNRGAVPKAYRFWANGERTLPDKDSYTHEYWVRFRELHGRNLLDFGSGLSKVAPYLNEKGFNCVDFEPYRIDPESDSGKPSPVYSKEKAREFLQTISNPEHHFDSIFLASVLNSVPFPEDRMAVLVIVHALSNLKTVVYGTCRDISDFHYEYGGIRQANYFVFDSEPGVRLGDAIANPKIQKFHEKEEMAQQLGMLWKTSDFWPGGNIFYWRAKNPKRVNLKVLAKALEIEFDLPYADGTRMGLVDEAKKAFGKRLGVKL